MLEQHQKHFNNIIYKQRGLPPGKRCTLERRFALYPLFPSAGILFLKSFVVKNRNTQAQSGVINDFIATERVNKRMKILVLASSISNIHGGTSRETYVFLKDIFILRSDAYKLQRANRVATNPTGKQAISYP